MNKNEIDIVAHLIELSTIRESLPWYMFLKKYKLQKEIDSGLDVIAKGLLK